MQRRIPVRLGTGVISNEITSEAAPYSGWRACEYCRHVLGCCRGHAIYKCKDAHGGLLYTDTPCKGGERLNLRSGVADPAAILRLERAQATLDELAAKRRADEALEELKEEAERLLREQAAAQRRAEAAAASM